VMPALSIARTVDGAFCIVCVYGVCVREFIPGPDEVKPSGQR
jgi:hypothetical protein